jgi:hypothetical protein
VVRYILWLLRVGERVWRLPEPSDSKIWSWVPWGSVPRITVLARASSNLLDWTGHNYCMVFLVGHWIRNEASERSRRMLFPKVLYNRWLNFDLLLGNTKRLLFLWWKVVMIMRWSGYVVYTGKQQMRTEFLLKLLKEKKTLVDAGIELNVILRKTDCREDITGFSWL